MNTENVNTQEPATGAVKSSPLLPCPFCGGEMKVEYEDLEHELEGVFYAECQKCGGRGPVADSTWDAVRGGNLRGVHELKDGSLFG